jgi:predicted NAD-dependent protein-ADP-ribosyltransferase YbiA (DUF1768 family)
MVQSKLRPAKVNYPEKKEIDPEDRGHSASLYEIKLFGEYYIITLGKEKYTYAKENVVYFPIYLVNANDKIKGRIGVYEIDLNDMSNVRDAEGDVDLDVLGKELLFQFTSPEYMRTLLELDPSIEKKEEEEEEEKEEEKEEEEEEDFFKITKEKGEEKEKGKEKMKAEDIFKIEDIPQPTWEETEKDSDDIIKEYKKNPNDKWIVTYMKNPNFNILTNESGGDCFFATIRDAYAQIGRQTTVKQLRALLAQEVTQDKYELNAKLYRDIQKEKEYLEMEMEKISKTMAGLKKYKEKQVKGIQDVKTVVDEAKKLKSEYEHLKDKKTFNAELLKDVAYMKHVHHLNDFREYVKTSDCWADSWAIMTLEQLLNVKFIILEHSDDPDAVMQCGEMPEVKGNLTPEYYIMVYYTGDHYELISYKKKNIFTFTEIPYAVKILIIKKCMEKNAGTFFLIPQFRQLKTDLVGSEPEEEPEEKNEVTFVFHANSDRHKKPGHGVGEQIPRSREPEFLQLYQKKAPWRQQLDDTWEAPFNLDNERWQTVSHYLLAVQFKDDPEIFKTFALDSGTHIAKSWAAAKESIEKKNTEGRYFAKYKNLRKLSEGSLNDYRELALRAKFSQNADLSTTLSNTKQAKLAHFVSKKPAKTDILLMKLRKELE